MVTCAACMAACLWGSNLGMSQSSNSFTVTLAAPGRTAAAAPASCMPSKHASEEGWGGDCGVGIGGNVYQVGV